MYPLRPLRYFLAVARWALSARESRVTPGRDAPGEGQVDYQLSDLRVFVGKIGGRVDREVPESNVTSFKRKRVMLPDGTYGYRVVRPDWETILPCCGAASATR